MMDWGEGRGKQISGGFLEKSLLRSALRDTWAASVQREERNFIFTALGVKPCRRTDALILAMSLRASLKTQKLCLKLDSPGQPTRCKIVVVHN